MMEIETLWAEIDRHVHPLPAERVSLSQANRRVIAETVIAATDQPAFDQSSMDGYAFSSAAPGRCRITATSAAGTSDETHVGAGEAVRIFTGAMVPTGTFAVARQEDCKRDGEFVEIAEGGSLVAHQNIRKCGGIFRKGSKVVDEGSVLSPGALALIASAGVGEVSVIRHATAIHLITGDELVSAGEPLPTGGTYDSNGPMFQAMLAAAGVQTTQMKLRDDAGALNHLVSTNTASLLLISGGSGPGDRDHTIGALEAANFVIHTSRLNSRPGKPLIFATRGNQVAFGLPGNPLAHWVCFHAFVSRAIQRLHGIEPPSLLSAKLSEAIDDAGDGRRTWTPARICWEHCELIATPLPWQHSGDLSPLLRANALIMDAMGNPGEHVNILSIDQ